MLEGALSLVTEVTPCSMTTLLANRVEISLWQMILFFPKAF